MSGKFPPIGIYSPAPQSGKSTVAEYLQSYHFAEMASLASPVKMMAASFLMNFGYSKERAEYTVFNDKTRIIPEINKDVRYILQTIGTEWGRNYMGQDVWANILAAKLEYKSKVVVDDVRFFNEASAIKSAGGLIWKVVRPGFIPKTHHASEGSLNNWDGFDSVILNDGTIEDLQDKVLTLINDAW